MLKKLLSTIIVCMLAISAVACSSGGSGGTENSNQGGKANSAETTNTPKKVEKVYVYSATQNDSTKAEDVELVKKEIMEKSGIEIVPVVAPVSQYHEKLNLLLASNDQLDLFANGAKDYRLKGAVQPLNQLIDKYGPHIKQLWPKKWDDTWKMVTDKDGNIWSIPMIPPLAEKTVYVRSDWLKKLNLQMPATMDELENVLKAFKEKDPAGNGQTIPLMTDLAGLNHGLAAGYLDFGYGDWLDKDGKIKPAELNPGYKEFIAKMAEWYQKGYIYKETFTLNQDRMQELVKQNRVAAAALRYSIVTPAISNLQKNTPEAQYDVAAQLKGPKGYVTTLASASDWSTMLSKNSKNPEAAIKLIDWLDSDIENYLLLFYGVKGKHWKYADEKNHVVERLNQNYNGELMTGHSFAYTVQFSTNDPTGKPEFDYLRTYSGDVSRAKKQVTVDVNYLYDYKEIANKLPNEADIRRMIDEEVTKFIMGARPMSDYDKFVQELYSAGLNNWIDVYTDQYNKAKSGK